jgi:hypothetical protein
VDGSPPHLKSDNVDGVGGLAATVGMQDCNLKIKWIFGSCSFDTLMSCLPAEVGASVHIIAMGSVRVTYRSFFGLRAY